MFFIPRLRGQLSPPYISGGVLRYPAVIRPAGAGPGSFFRNVAREQAVILFLRLSRFLVRLRFLLGFRSLPEILPRIVTGNNMVDALFPTMREYPTKNHFVRDRRDHPEKFKAGTRYTVIDTSAVVPV